jgi:predicted regulator of Ras-like GTPase activity (Roadblock/LC7/MglB family)
MREEPAVTFPIGDELQLIRNNVPRVRGSIAATTGGLLVAHDVPGLEPTQVATLVAATHAVAARASLSTECGPLKEVMTRGNDGYLTVYAAGGRRHRRGPRDHRPERRHAELPGTHGDRAHRRALQRPRQKSAGGLPRCPRRARTPDGGRAGREPLPARRPRVE